MKKSLIILLVLAVSFSMLLGGCGNKEVDSTERRCGTEGFVSNCIHR